MPPTRCDVSEVWMAWVDALSDAERGHLLRAIDKRARRRHGLGGDALTFPELRMLKRSDEQRAATARPPPLEVPKLPKLPGLEVPMGRVIPFRPRRA
jgi:hypothetical protein